MLGGDRGGQQEDRDKVVRELVDHAEAGAGLAGLHSVLMYLERRDNKSI